MTQGRHPDHGMRRGGRGWPSPRGARRLVADFARRERGSMIVFSLFMLVIMLMVGGFAVDLMRTEVMRTRLQSTLDRSLLAAADLEQRLAPEEVVADYFDRAGLAAYAPQDITVDKGVNFRSVAARTSADVPSLFLRLADVDSLPAVAGGMARERIPKIEISLVLDVSGSMRYGDNTGMPKIDSLRPAADAFIEEMLEGDRKDLTSISIVPYAGGTNPGRRVYQAIGGQLPTAAALAADDDDDDGDPDDGETDSAWQVTEAGLHEYSHCPELRDADFDTAGLPDAENYDAESYDQVPHFMKWEIAPSWMDWGWCPSDDTSIRYFSGDSGQLTDFIDNMRLHDGTGTHYAIRWGLALLAPGTQTLTADLANDGVVADKFSDRPAAWDDEETLKVIVLMTDGEITDQFRPTDPSDPANGRTELNNRASGEQERSTRRSENVDNFEKSCNLAKANGVTIYTIAFATNSRGRDEMRGCASTVNHYYNVQGLDIEEAFNSIAGHINRLRLTQ